MRGHMKITLDSRKPNDIKVDLLVIAADKDWKPGDLGPLDQRVNGRLSAEIRRQGFKGAAGEVALFQTHATLPARYILVAGIGDATTSAPWYKLAHTTVTR